MTRLHGTRTEAQHRGTVPDAVEFGRWSADTERFINSLVAAAFGPDLQTVGVAQAVRTPEVRSLLETAEEKLWNGNFKDSCQASLEALKTARTRWANERRTALGGSESAPSSMEDIMAAITQSSSDLITEIPHL